LAQYDARAARVVAERLLSYAGPSSYARGEARRGAVERGGSVENDLLTKFRALRIRCWACGGRATDIYFLIRRDRARSIAGACADSRHDLLRQWDIAASEGDPLVCEAGRILGSGDECYGPVPIAELLDRYEAADWERQLRGMAWGDSGLALLRAAGRS
jgi:hypothetical protein